MLKLLYIHSFMSLLWTRLSKLLVIDLAIKFYILSGKDTPGEWKKAEEFSFQSPKRISLAFEPNTTMERKTLMQVKKTF